MAVLKALPGAPDFKALPGSAKINGEPVKDNQPIKGKLISIKNLLLILVSSLIGKRNRQKNKRKIIENRNKILKEKRRKKS